MCCKNSQDNVLEVKCGWMVIKVSLVATLFRNSLLVCPALANSKGDFWFHVFASHLKYVIALPF